MDNITKQFTDIVDNYCNSDTGIQSLYENEAHILIQREIHEDIEYLITILGEVIKRDIEEYIPDDKEIYVFLVMAALDQVDFEKVAKPFIDIALEDKRQATEIQQSQEMLMGVL